MALTDLLNNITSFDYTQVGQPQSFEANGRLVTGQQTFQRPIEEPLPITETQVGFNTRENQESVGLNFFNDTFASGFTPNAQNLDTQFNSLDIEQNVSSLIPKNDLIGDATYGWTSPTEPFAVDFLNNNFVQGFKLNRAPSNSGPGQSDMTQDFNPSLTYTIPNGNNVTSQLQTDGAYTEYSSFIDTYVQGFKRNRAPQGNGPGESDIVGLDLEANTSTFTPITNDVFKWSASNVPFAVNFFDNFGSVSYSAFRTNGDTPNVNDSHVDGFIKNKIGVGAFRGETDFKFSALQFANRILINGQEFGGENFGNAEQISSITSGPVFNKTGENIPFRRDTRFEKDMEFKKSRFFDTDTSETPILNYYMNNVSLKVENPFATGDDPTSFTIEPANQSFQYSEKFVGGGIGNTKQISYSAGETLKEYAESRLKNRDQFIKFEKGKPNSQDFEEYGTGDRKYKDFVRDMSFNPGLGFRQPYVIRGQGQEWGFDGNEENVDGFSFGSIVDSIDTLGNAFYRGAVGFSGLLDREIMDKVRVGKWYLSNVGVFSIKQLALQSQNPSIHTRIWNPISLLSDNTFIRFQRHLGGDFVEPLPLPGSIKEFLKKAINIDTQPFLQSSIIYQATAGEDIASSSTPGETDSSSPVAGLLNRVRGAISEFTSLSDYKSLVQTNKPHFLSISLPGPLSKLRDKKEQLKSGFTFSNKRDGQGISENQGFNQKTKPIAGGFPDEGADFVGAYMGNKYDEVGDSSFEYTPKGSYNADSRSPEDPALSGMASIASNNLGVHGLGDDRIDSLADIVTNTADGRQLVMKTGPEAAYENTLYVRNITKPYKRMIPLRVDDENQSSFTTEEYKEQLENIDRLNLGAGAIDTSTHDNVNAYPVTNQRTGTGTAFGQDFVDFQFRVKHYNEEGISENRYLKFRATFADISDTITPAWNETKFIGRADKVYTYSGADRELQISFKIFPKSIIEMPFLLEKLNMLAGANYPQYTKSDFMIGPLIDMKLGDMYDYVPGYMTSFSMNIVESTTWEIDLFEFPKNIDVSMGFKYIGKRRPHGLGKQFDIPYFQVNGTDNSGVAIGDDDKPLESSVYNGSMYLTNKELDYVGKTNPRPSLTNRTFLGYDDFLKGSQPGGAVLYEKQAEPASQPENPTTEQNEPAPGTETTTQNSDQANE